MHPALIDAVDPFAPFAVWFAEAVASEPRVPDAMQLATVGDDGRPSVRTVLLKDHGPAGFVFYTNLSSRKGLEIARCPAVALVLHWKSLERQVVIDGSAVRVPDAEADAYWASRPRGSQLSAVASDQSAILEAPGDLEDRMARAAARWTGRDVPRPSGWGGLRVVPDRVEFWQGRRDRMHERLVFEATDQGWRQYALYP